jgi:hypothetical protein
MAKDGMIGAHSFVVDQKVNDALGLLDAGTGAYRSTDLGWCPTPPSAEQDRFTMADLVLFATESAP